MNVDQSATESHPPEPFIPALERGPRILARTFFRELQAQGFNQDQILAFAGEIIAMARDEGDMPRAVTPGR